MHKYAWNILTENTAHPAPEMWIGHMLLWCATKAQYKQSVQGKSVFVSTDG